jgi:NADPH:quinone reductase-like Zn-dependent oxidoreductase
MPTIEELRASGEIGGRTVQIVADGGIECVVLEPAALEPDSVRIRTERSAVSPGTESTYIGRDASNVHLAKRWNPELRLFEAGAATISHPIAFGYRAAGTVVESRSALVGVGERVWGNWRHTELVAMPASAAALQRLPEGIDWDDAVDIGQMGPIGVNAVAFGGAEQRGHPAVVFGAGPIGLITAQLVRLAGADPTVVIDRLAMRLRVAADLGLETVDAADVDVAVKLKRRFGSDGVPVAWECTGSVPALAEAIRTVSRRGLVVAVGFYQDGAADLALGEEFHHNGVRVVSAQIGNPYGSLTRRDLQLQTLELVAGRRLMLGGLPRLTLPVERAAEGFAALRRPDEVLQVAFAYDADVGD